MGKLKIGLGVAAGLFVAYWAAAPYITVYQMRAAAEAHDGEALSEHIEFPSVRQNLKDQMNALFARKMTEDEDLRDNPFAALGAAFAGVMIDKMVDAYVTPAGIQQMMAGEKPEPGAARKPSTGSASGSTPDERKPFANADLGYKSLDKFEVRVTEEDSDEAIRFILRRQGLTGWKLTEILLPLD